MSGNKQEANGEEIRDLERMVRENQEALRRMKGLISELKAHIARDKPKRAKPSERA